MQVDSNSCHPELPAALGCARCAQLHKLTFEKHLQQNPIIWCVVAYGNHAACAPCRFHPEPGLVHAGKRQLAFHYTGIMPPIKSIPAVVYVTKAVLGEVTSGCGASNQKCNCTVSQYDGDQGLYYGFNMAGRAPMAPLRGLGLHANFLWQFLKVFLSRTGENTCQCDLTINIPFTATTPL